MKWLSLLLFPPMFAAAPQWTQLGPQPTVDTSQLATSGRVTALAVDPRSDSTVYLGAPEGGVWKTTDGGTSWAPLTDYEPSLSIGALAVAPANPDIVYAATGEGSFSPGNYYGAGILKSTDAASYANPALAAPDEYISIFGPQLASGTTIASTVPLPATLAGSSVTVTDSKGASQPAAMYFVSALQVNCILPSTIAPGPITVTLAKPDGTSATVTMRSEPTAPGLFSANANGMGVAVAAAFYVRASGVSQQPAQLIYQCASGGTCSATPIDLGPSSDQVVLELFGTGLRHSTRIQAVTATIGGFPATVLFAGAGGGYAGLDQVNVLVPRDLIGKGEVPILLAVDGKQANSVTVAFK